MCRAVPGIGKCTLSLRTQGQRLKATLLLGYTRISVLQGSFCLTGAQGDTKSVSWQLKSSRIGVCLWVAHLCFLITWGGKQSSINGGRGAPPRESPGWPVGTSIPHPHRAFFFPSSQLAQGYRACQRHCKAKVTSLPPNSQAMLG